MAVNRYYTPAELNYVSQYAPIPFQELFALGKSYADELEKAQNKLSEHIKSVGEFRSLIDKDNQSYYDTAINQNVRSVMDAAAANPELMKTVGWRSSLNNALNSVNYGDLSMLKQSAEQANLYYKLYASLAA